MESFKGRKLINAWSVVRGNSEFGNFGDIVFTFLESGERRINKIPQAGDHWYFYCDPGVMAEKILKQIGIQYVIGNKYLFVPYPKNRFRDPNILSLVERLESSGVKTYEADLGPMKRWCLDQDIQIEDFENLKILYFDIETDDTLDRIAIGEDRILSFGGVDQDGNEYFLWDKDEKKLLIDIYSLCKRFDMIVGWNSLGFDLPYLVGGYDPKKKLKFSGRFERNHLSGEYIWNMLHEDMMKRVQYFYAKDPTTRQDLTSYSLENVSQYFLGEGKRERKEKVIDLYKKDFDRFKEYNLQDCRLLKKLEDKLGTIKLTHKMFQWCQVFPQNWTMVKALDNYILSDANKKGQHYPTNIRAMKGFDPTEKEDEEYLGAFVIQPKPGMYENVYDLDFKSLYPNIIRTFNISPDTVDEDGEIVIPEIKTLNKKKELHGGIRFSSKTGIIPGKIEKLLQERAEIRDQMKKVDKDSREWRDLNVKQLCVKELANSIYGVLGNKYYRNYSVDVAEAITCVGQYLITFIKKYQEDRGRKVIYGDTDSVFLTIKKGESIEDVLLETNLEIKEHLILNFGVKKVTIEMATDCQFDKFLIMAKKKYTGIIDGKTKYVGLECVKRDTVKIAVNVQKDLIDKIFSNAPVNDIMKHIDSLKKWILDGSFTAEEICVTKKLTRELDDYKMKNAPHVKIARRMKEEGKSVLPNQILRYIITSSETTGLEGITIDEYTGEFDRTYFWNQVFFPLLQRILSTVYKKVKWENYMIIPPKKERKKRDAEGNTKKRNK